MPISPWFSGATLPPWQIALVDPIDQSAGGGTQPSDLGGLVSGNFSITFTNLFSGAAIAGTGVFTTSGVKGQVFYQTSAGDSATLGTYRVTLTAVYPPGVNATYPNGGTKDWDLGTWQVVKK